MANVGAIQHAQLEPRRACQECNRKKTRCDMRRPVCGLCARTGNACHFPSRRKRPTARTPQPTSESRTLSDSLSKLIQAFEAAAQTGQQSDPVDGQSRAPQSLLRETLKDLLAEVGQSAGQSLEERAVSSGNDDRSASIEGGSDDEAQLFRRPSIPNANSAPSPTASGAEDEIPGPLANELVNLFFEKVQRWLPILHRPRFKTRYEATIRGEGDVMKTLSPEEGLLFYSMFAMAARFSTHPRLARVASDSRGQQFAERARQLYTQGRMHRTPSLTYLQGCILLAFYFYTSGPTQQGWVLIGVCVRLAYDLGLNEIDEEDWTPATPVDPVYKEEMRRAWWLTWELDTFASTVSRKPYSIDRKRMAVALPISDEAWFSGVQVPSAQLLVHPGQSWRSLQGSPNQDERAWFLLANHFMATVHDRLQQKQDISAEEKLTLENEICCFRLALPPSVSLDSETLNFSPSTFARCNFAIGIHLMLTATSYLVAGIAPSDSDGHGLLSLSTTTTSPLRQRAISLSRIISVWDAKYIEVAHPFYTCMMLPPLAVEGVCLRSQPLVSSTHDLAKLVLKRFADKWKLGSVVAELSTCIERGGPLTTEENQLVKRYATFFHMPRLNTNSPGSMALDVFPRDKNGPETSDNPRYTGSLGIPQVSPETQDGYPASFSVPALSDAAIHQTAMFDPENVAGLQPNMFDSAGDIDFGFADFFGDFSESDLLLP
ncbi:hypothetical protein A1O3_02833 [Capronia epimyces CBS 606.96]|uniref:Zn(2)-C6 fungal-type domain-containing protein n=1 Tax=Capronia epimyces CBS 606.96 TaxID=1182542 RepID=W9YKJ2_9EURO|nr:uncharacterized protein A1O3_02833 [Capronia epimyces CBS 606.96]EXJ89766.1 hypothetical protein A1O3_02833 [Capronia epimyces CBS 606.96]